MKRKLTDNLGLKIGSILFAALLWLLVTNINNPSMTHRYNDIPVTLINTEYLTGQGKTYEVLDNSDRINTVTITGPRTIVNSIRQGDILAVADMSRITTDNTVPIQISSAQYNENLDSIKMSSEEVLLKVEERKSISLPLKASTSGPLQEGYIIGDVTTDQNLVRVSGPESLVSAIASAEVSVAVGGFTGDIGRLAWAWLVHP